MGQTFSAWPTYSLLRVEESEVKMNVRRSVTMELILEAWKSINFTSLGWFWSEYLNRIFAQQRSP